MAVILQKDNPILRHKARPVSPDEIDTPAFKKILVDMRDAMYQQKDGIAIAAPQIGVPLRVFLVSGSLLKQADKTYTGDGSDLVFINPEITKLSKDKHEVEEGCLSVRWLYGTMRRSTRATIRALNEKGEKIERGAQGLLAQIFQHECDHLDGILFIDHATDVWEMTEEEIAEAQDAH